MYTVDVCSTPLVGIDMHARTSEPQAGRLMNQLPYRGKRPPPGHGCNEGPRAGISGLILLLRTRGNLS
jgi:hypothetical protein